MQADDYYQRVVEFVQRPSEERHRGFCELHDQVLAGYLDAVRSMTAEQAAQPVADGRSLAQVVGHIAEWDRYLILAAGEMLAGAAWPQMMNFRGYLDQDGRVLSFGSIDEFNAYQAEKHAAWPWEQIQTTAIDAAVALHALFTHKGLLSSALLEKGRPFAWRLPEGKVLNIPVGWYVWNIVLEHEGVEHARDLRMN